MQCVWVQLLTEHRALAPERSIIPTIHHFCIRAYLDCYRTTTIYKTGEDARQTSLLLPNPNRESESRVIACLPQKTFTESNLKM